MEVKPILYPIDPIIPVYSNEDYLLELIVESGLITHDEIAAARTQLKGAESVVEHLITGNRLTDEQGAQVCAQSSSMEYVELRGAVLDSDLFSQIPEEVARRFRIVPISDDGFALTVAISDPLNFEVLDTLPHVLGREVNPVCAIGSAIDVAIQNNYGGVETAVEEHSSDDITFGDEGDNSTEDAPVIKMVQGILSDALKMGASDIHIEPLEASLRIRNRVDGKLIEVANHPKKLLPAIIARLKVMSSTMSIAEKRLPQDGRIQIKSGKKDVDLRVSSVPSSHGESIVMRILDKSALVLGLGELGFLSDDQEDFRRYIKLPDGIILVTGPTGSGKTTTLYACLNYINSPDRKIITVEDPVEYEMPGINQVMVKSDIGMTFSAALRAMLRQAPNVIMIGEIRDEETANIAINASLTGHLVFSTLHTNDAPSTVARLADIGVKRFLVASAVRAIIAQRLVRKLCPVCKTPAELDEKELRMLNIDHSHTANSTIYGPQGCDQCRNNGYRGRMGIFEILEVDNEVSHLINENLTSPQLRKRARELGMRTLREDGIRKIQSGLTSASEVIGVTMSDMA